MNGKHAITISLAAGLAAIAGTIAATKSVQLGRSGAAAASQSSSALVAQRNAQLDRAGASLRKALAQKPPKLPPLPGTVAGGSAPGAQPAAPRVVYVRPAPHIVTIHRAGGEHESELEAAGGEHEGGGKFDD
jgi:hypothetical protein